MISLLTELGLKSELGSMNISCLTARGGYEALDPFINPMLIHKLNLSARTRSLPLRVL